MKILRTLIITASVFILTLLTTSTVLAKDLEVNHVAGPIEKIEEKIILIFKFDKNSKADYLKYLSEKRLAEIVYVVKVNKIDSVEETASRFSTYLGNLTNYVISQKLTEKKDALVQAYLGYAEILKDQQKGFKYDSGWWLALQHPINLSKVYSEQLKKL